MSTERRPLILAVESSRSFEFGHLTCCFMTRSEKGDLFMWTEPWSDMRFSPKLPALDCLTISCQWSEKDKERGPYAWDVTFGGLTNVDLMQAKRMVKTLQTIAGIIKRKNLHDYVEGMTFGRYVHGLAQGMGVDEVVLIERKPTGCTRDFEVSPVPLSEVAEVIDRRILDVRSGKVSPTRVGRL